MRHASSRVRVGVVGTACLTLALTACGGGGGGSDSSEANGVSTKEITIGVISDITGPSAANQVPYVNGIKAYFAAVNKSGGINDREVKVVVEDDKLQVPAAVSAYRKFLKQEPALAVMGLVSSVQAAIAPQSRKENLPIVATLTTSKDMVNPLNKNFFSAACTYADQADVAVAFLAKQAADAGVTNPTAMVAIPPVSSGEEWLKAVQDRAKIAGIEVVGSQTVDYTALDADVLAQEVSKKKPDMFFLHGATGTAQVVMKSLAKFGVTDLPIATTAVLQDPLIPSAGPNVASGYYTMNCYTTPSAAGAAGEEVIAAAKAAGFSEKDYDRPEFTQGYVGALILATGIEDAGEDLTRDSLRSALEKVDSHDTGGLSPVISFAPDQRVGVSGVRPYLFEADTQQFVPVGEFEDYSDCITNVYVTETIDDWKPDCVTG